MAGSFTHEHGYVICVVVEVWNSFFSGVRIVVGITAEEEWVPVF
jgi:hypothetical protein